jgi:hypothetical protein
VKPILTLQEIAISLVSKERQEELNFTNLKERGIIPDDWMISRSPSYSDGTSQMIFNNGLQIIIRSNTLTFLEPLKINSSDLRISKATTRYIEAFKADYQEVFIDVRSFVTFEDGDTKSAYEYIKKILSFKYRLQSSLDPSQINLSLIYDLDECQLNLKISEAKLDLPGGQVIPAVLISFKFLYRVAGHSSLERLNHLSYAINQSSKNLQIHREFLHSNFEI